MPLTTMKLQGRIEEGFKTEIQASHKIIIDQPKAAGGNNEGPNPMEVFLAALPACICAIGRIISNQKKLNVRAIDVKLEADIDKMFLLGQTDEGRAGFQEIRVFVDVEADMSKEEKEAFIHEVERRCPIADNITNTSVIKTTVV